MGVLQYTEMTGQNKYVQCMEDNAQTAWDNRRLSNNLLYGNWWENNVYRPDSSSRGNSTGVLLMNYLNLLSPNNINTYVGNPNFEANGVATQTPTLWNKYNFGNSANDSASFTESKASPYNAHSGNYTLTHYKSTAYQIYNFQTLSGLPNCMYTMKAWAIG